MTCHDEAPAPPPDAPPASLPLTQIAYSGGMDDDAAQVWLVRNQLTADEINTRVHALPDGPERTYLRGWIAAVSGRTDEALELLTAASQALARDDEWQGRAQRTLGDVLGDLGDDLAAEEHYLEALRLFEIHDDVYGRVATLQNSADLGFHSGASKRARLDEALALAEPLDNDELTTVVLLNLGHAWLDEDPVTARRHVERGLEKGADLPNLRAHGLALLGRMALDAGDVEEAGRYLDQLDHTDERLTFMTRLDIAVPLSTLARRRDDLDTALTVLQGAMRPQMHPAHEAQLQAELSHVHEAAGDLSAAVAAARRCGALKAELLDNSGTRRAHALESWRRSQELRTRNESARVQIDTLEQAVAQLRAAHAQIEALAVTDALTGIHNRQHLLNLGPSILATATTEQPAQIALLDIDRFKHINDTLGHNAGDQALLDVARLLRAHTRSADLLCRHGGDEFVVLRPPHVEGSLVEDLSTVCEAVRRGPSPAWRTEDAHGRTPGISVGVAHVTSGDLDHALTRADAIMYRSKRAGGNRVTTDELPDGGTTDA